MQKIEVLRSDVSIRKNVETAVASMKKRSASVKFIQEEAVSAVLAETGISNVEIEERIVEKASGTLPCIGQRSLPPSPNNAMHEVPYDSEVLDFTYASSIKNNLPLENNYVDKVRGNVIHVTAKGSACRREFGVEDHEHLKVYGVPELTNSRGEYKKFFLYTDGTENKVSNCFRGQDLSNGATLSFWVRFHDRDAVIRNAGLITFLGDYEKHYFDSESRKVDREYVDYTTHLSFTAGLNISYDEAFQNTYNAVSEIYPSPDPRIDQRLYRSGKAWMHVIVSFTDEEIRCYINGMPVDYYDVKKGKRFGVQDGRSELAERTRITDFLSDEKTNLYLALTLGESKISEMMLFDDVTFWAGAVESDVQAAELYEEASEINLP